MSTQPERKSAFSTLALAAHFLHEAEKLGLTPALLQRLRESPQRMLEFVSLARLAQADHIDRVTRLQYEEECAVDIDGVHYHLVLITLGHLADWGCMKDGLVKDVVRVAARNNYEPLREEAYPTVDKLLKTVSSPGQWIGWTNYDGLVWWERTASAVESRGSFGDARGMSLSYFTELRGMVFMQKFMGCDYNPAFRKR